MHYIEPEVPSSGQIKFVLDKVIDGMSSKNFDKIKNIVCIYFSLNEILEYFLDSDYSLQILRSLSSGQSYRDRTEIAGIKYPDDILHTVFKYCLEGKLIKGYYYMHNDKDLQLEEVDKENDIYNTLGFDPWNEIKSTGLIHQLQEGIFCTKENILLSVGWWCISIPPDFLVKLIKQKIKHTNNAYLVGDYCVISLDNLELIGELGGKKLRERHGGKKSKNVENLEYLIDYHFSEDPKKREYAERNLNDCSKDDAHELQKLFRTVTREQIISFKNEELRFAYKDCRKIS